MKLTFIFAKCVPLIPRIIRCEKELKVQCLSFAVSWSDHILYDLNKNSNELKLNVALLELSPTG